VAKDISVVADVLKDITKRYDLRIGAMSTVVDPVVGLTTGNLAIDYLTGIGGLPQARITELYGQPSSGKTTTALQAAAALQRDIIAAGRDEHILYLDFEHAMDGEYAAVLGLDVEHPTFILVQPNWLEDGQDIAKRLVQTGRVRLCIWDSVAEMTPKELEFGVRTNAMERARLLNSMLQHFNSLFHEHNCAGVFLNHMTEVIAMGGRPGMPAQETSPGGKSLKFYASLRLAYKQVRNIKGQAPDALTGAVTTQVVATDVRVRVTKNKVGVPFREAEVRVRLGQGFDNLWSALTVLTAHKSVVAGSTGHFYFDPAKVPALVHDDMARSGTGRPYIRGGAALLAFADDHPDWARTVVATAASVVESVGAASLSVPTDVDLAEEDLLVGLLSEDAP